MKAVDMQALATKGTKNIRTKQNFNEFKKLLTKMTL
jgi:hypothetical protein